MKINFKDLFTKNLWLKFMSLVIAVIVWLYVSSELTKGIKI